MQPTIPQYQVAIVRFTMDRVQGQGQANIPCTGYLAGTQIGSDEWYLRVADIALKLYRSAAEYALSWDLSLLIPV